MWVVSGSREEDLAAGCPEPAGLSPDRFSASGEGLCSSAPSQICPGFESRELREDLIQSSAMTRAVPVPASCRGAVGVTWQEQLLSLPDLQLGRGRGGGNLRSLPRISSFPAWQAQERCSCPVALCSLSLEK